MRGNKKSEDVKCVFTYGCNTVTTTYSYTSSWFTDCNSRRIEKLCWRNKTKAKMSKIWTPNQNVWFIFLFKNDIFGYFWSCGNHSSKNQDNKLQLKKKNILTEQQQYISSHLSGVTVNSSVSAWATSLKQLNGFCSRGRTAPGVKLNGFTIRLWTAQFHTIWLSCELAAELIENH